MALTSDEINKLKEQLKEINQLSNQLGAGIDVKKFADVEKWAKEIKLMFDALSKRLVEAGENTDYLVSNFQELVSSIQKSSSGVQQTNKALKTLSSISLSINEHQRGYNDLTSKDVKKLEEKLGKQKNILHISQLLLKAELDNLNFKAHLTRNEEKDRDKIVKSLKTGNDLLKNFNKDSKILQDALSKTKDEVEEIEKYLGLSGALTSSLSDSLSKLGMGGLARQLGIDEAKSKMDNLAKSIVKNKQREKQLDKEIADARLEQLNNLQARRKAAGKKPLSTRQLNTVALGSKSLSLIKEKEGLASTSKMGQGDVMAAGIKSMGASLKKNLTDPLVIGGFLFTQILDAFQKADKGAGDLAKGFNMTYNEAMNVREELTQIGNSSGDVALNTRALQESMMAVGQALGSNAMLNEKDLVTFTKLREQAGFTNDELLGIEKTTLATGGNLEKNAKNILYSAKLTGLNNKVLLNEKDIMRDVAKASDAIKLSLGGSGKKLGEAAAQAKALGMSLEQVDKIAGSLLDFESSITNELSAELITGKQINLEQARLYALNNDMAGLSREIAKNFGSVAEYSKMNRIQQEAAAKAVGMSREELATTLTDQTALKGLSGDKLKDAQAALDLARAQGMTEEQIAQKGIDGLSQQQGVQERLTMAVEKMKEAFVGIVEAFSPIIDLFANLLTYVAKSKMAMLALQTVIAGLAVKSLVTAIASIFTGSAILGPVGLGIAAAGTVALMAYVNSAKATPMAKGGIIPATPGGTLIQAGEAGKAEAIIPLDNSGGFNIKTSSPPQQRQQQQLPIDYSKFAGEMAKAMSSQPIHVSSTVDGNVLTQAVANRATPLGNTLTKNVYKIA